MIALKKSGHLSSFSFHPDSQTVELDVYQGASTPVTNVTHVILIMHHKSYFKYMRIPNFASI